MIALVMMLAALAGQPGSELPAGVTCELVRAEVAQHGRAAAIAWALRQGTPWRQIRAAMACLDHH
jgi:hypothetical protein